MAECKKFSEFKKIPVESRWFTVWKIYDDIYAIYEPYHFQEVISYLIIGKDSALLWDSGMGIGDIKAIVSRLTDKPVTLCCSHSHFDHVGGAWQFGNMYLLNIPESIFLIENGYSMPSDDENRSEEAFWFEGDRWFNPETYCVRPCNVIPIDEGYIFDLGSRKLRVLATPGHAKDAIMLCDDDNKILFTGDTVYPAPLYSHFEGDSESAVYQKTMEKLADSYSDYTLICSHNNPVMYGTALREIADAFQSIRDGNVSGRSYLGHTGYDFDGFSIVI